MDRRRIKTVPFSLRTIFRGGPGDKSLLIITHRDLDGLISAFLLANVLRSSYKDIDVLFSQPYFSVALRKYIAGNCKPSRYRDLAMLDLSVDYLNPKSSRKLFEYIQPRLCYLFDHHTGWIKLLRKVDCEDFNLVNNGELEKDNKKQKYIVLGSTPSCAELIYAHFNLAQKGCQYLDDLLKVATISDDLKSRQKFEGTRWYEAFIRLKNRTIEGALAHIIKHKDITHYKKSKINWYSRNRVEARKVLESAEEIYPGIAYLKGCEDIPFNYTSLCEEAYKKYRIVIIKDIDAKHLKINYTVAHAIPNLDLTKLFKLPGGSPRRVTICRKGETIGSLVKKLKPFLEEGTV